MQFLLYFVQALKLGRYSLSAKENQTEAFKPVQDELKNMVADIKN